MSEEYQVIARKYRPMRFADVVGQEHVIRTLKNAIKDHRTAHAYLFVGPRGIGKTTLARIFAKALNCENPQAGEPCCKCPSCLAIAEDSSLDVIEIDAASRNSVGEMRELTDEILHMPVASRYKIYIIDEIHMLSNAAWNALLKTVEEPPAHVKFIFATTEVHKVLPTIISRCQRFDLTPIPSRLIAERLKFIADDQKIAIAPQALDAIARAADGGMRDAQSLLDQIIAFFGRGDGREISAQEVLSLFGLTDAAELDSLLEAMLLDRPALVVSAIASLSGKGRNLETLFDDILNAVRAVEMCLLFKDPSAVLDETPEALERYRALSKHTDLDKVQILLEVLAPAGPPLRNALNKQVFIETVLLRAMRESNAVKISDLVARLNQLRAAGELNFIEQLPANARQEAASAAQIPPTKAPAPAIEVAADAAAVETVEPLKPAEAPEIVGDTVSAAVSLEVANDPVDPPENVGAAERGGAAVDPEPTPAERYGEFIAFLDRNAFDPVLLADLRQGEATSFDGGILQIEFSLAFPAAKFADLEAANPRIQQVYQQYCGDWASSIKLSRPVEVEPPAKVEIPEFTDPDDDPSTVESGDFDGVEGEDGSGSAPAVPKPEAVRLDPVIAASVNATSAPVERKNAKWASVMNTPGSVESAAKNTEVKDLLDLFGGSIIDIHEKQEK